MKVQAKFWVTNITHHAPQRGNPDANAATVELQPVYGDGENSDWSKYTPSGKIEMMITNPTAVEQFELGESYLLTFEKVDK